MPQDLFRPERLVFVDIETTGSSAKEHKITEIGALLYENGKLTKKFSKLINPACEIPFYITNITGITNHMVVASPTFGEVADELYQFLCGSLFVAHNAQFDYGFIKNEFERVGIEYKADRLCTVQLSKTLFPQYDRHNLDEIIHRMGIRIERRHRAFYDAEALLKFYEEVNLKFSHVVVENVIRRLVKRAI